MPGLVPGIHIFSTKKTWMAGTNPDMIKLFAKSKSQGRVALDALRHSRNHPPDHFV